MTAVREVFAGKYAAVPTLNHVLFWITGLAVQSDCLLIKKWVNRLQTPPCKGVRMNYPDVTLWSDACFFSPCVMSVFVALSEKGVPFSPRRNMNACILRTVKSVRKHGKFRRGCAATSCRFVMNARRRCCLPAKPSRHSATAHNGRQKNCYQRLNACLSRDSITFLASGL